MYKQKSDITDTLLRGDKFIRTQIIYRLMNYCLHL